MLEIRPSPRWLPVLGVAALLALAALVQVPERMLGLALAVRAEPSFRELPGAAGWSLLRMTGSFAASLVFAWITGYWAATSPRAARVILPLLDVGQSVPVLGFFPAAIFVFVKILGGGRVSLELAAMFLIFTSQAWNMAFAVYEGLRTIPFETRAAVDSLGVRGLQRFRALLLPACVPQLLFNSILSWANGWYFLIACEIIVAGPVAYDLPGLGSTLSRAMAKGDLRLAVATLVVLVTIVLLIEFFVWSPLRTWSRRFRYDTQAGAGDDDALLHLPDLGLPRLVRLLRAILRPLWRRLPVSRVNRALAGAGGVALRGLRVVRWPALVALAACATLALVAVARTLAAPWPREAASLPLALLFSFLRIAAAYVLALLWILPVTLWASDHPRGLRGLSVVAQVGASIPATGFFPVLVALFVNRFGGMEIISVALALTGMQWYLLFNMLAGVQRVPTDLRESLRAFGLTRGQIHRHLVLPACMPSLATGSVVAWGGTWNALILSEYVVYRERTYQVLGIGQMLNQATFGLHNRTLLFLSLALLVGTVVAFNRLVWERLYRYVHDRYRMEG
jgi:NitT/TauT family transport system permease protein